MVGKHADKSKEELHNLSISHLDEKYYWWSNFAFFVQMYEYACSANFLVQSHSATKTTCIEFKIFQYQFSKGNYLYKVGIINILWSSGTQDIGDSIFDILKDQHNTMKCVSSTSI